MFLQKGPASVEFFADKGITKPADLKGKTVGGTPGDAMYATFPAWLKANGIEPADVKVVNVDAAGKIAALTEGKVDAIMGFFHDQAPDHREQDRQEGRRYLLFADYGMNLLGTGLVANDRLRREEPELVKAFVRATQKSWAEAAKDTGRRRRRDGRPGRATSRAKEVLVEQLTLDHRR